MPRAARLLALVGASHPEPAVAVTAVTTVLAAATGRPAAQLAGVAAAVLAGQLSVGWLNDGLDAGRDLRTGRTDKPVARGAVSAGAVLAAAGTAATAAVPLSLLSGPRAAAAHLGAVALAWAYDWPLKFTALSFLPYAGAFALLPAFVTLGLPGTPAPPVWACVAGALLGIGAHLANALPDLDADLATGVRGLPHRIGRRRATGLAAALLLAASAVLAFGPGRPGPLVAGGLVAATAVVVTGLARGRIPGSRAPFRATLVVAVLDVAMLVGQGSSLR